ncbi:uncharacterized protein LOC126574435 [Anopheles aquasalis]|uniref:uncharacterized protein LOC126574435 n=1 Tax=Anopheles aquasalis TaxID=42839 RepID=UPI00215A9E89|nr:uncharacterized protein LOC126574435 [Anopheles aquasalis]
MWKLSVLVTLAVVGSVVSVDNIDIDIKVDSDSKLYHQGKTAEGSFNYGYNVPRQNNNQFQHKVKGPDDVTYGCYGFVDPKNGAHLYHYVSDLKGYRVVAPYKPTTVYSARVANSVADIYDAVGIKYDWEKLYFPDVCRLLQRSKDERNDLSIPPDVIINDDGSVSRVPPPPPPPPSKPTTRAPPPTTTTRRPAPTTTTPRPTPRPTPRANPPTQPPTPRRTTPAPRPPPPPPPPRTTPRQVVTRPPVTRPPIPVEPPRTNPPPPPPPPTTRRPPPPPPTTTRRPAPPPTTRPPPPPPRPVTRAPPPPAPRVTPKPTPQPPKNNGNKFVSNRDNFIGQETGPTNQIAKPQPDLEAVSYEIHELRTLVQNLLKQLNRNGPDCDDDGKSLGPVDPNAKHVFLPLVIVEQLPGVKSGAGGAGAGGVALPPGSQFAIPSVGYGVSRCNNCG